MTTTEHQRMLQESGRSNRSTTKNAFARSIRQSQRKTPTIKKNSPRGGGLCSCFKPTNYAAPNDMPMAPEKRKK